MLVILLTGLIITYFQSQDLKTAFLLEKGQKSALEKTLSTKEKEIKKLLEEDQRKRNDELQKEVTQVNQTYKKSAQVYEQLLDLKPKVKDTSKYDKSYAAVVKLLADKKYKEAGEALTKLAADIKTEQDKIAATFAIPANVPVNNAPPGSGFSRQQVQSDAGNFLVDIISADLASTRVIVDTASDGTCANDCPVLSLGEYASRSGAYAGINGSYFCPASYPACAGKTNSFDTLLMNKNKVYFNSDNNQYSTVPAVIFGTGWIRFVGRSLDWGRDTGIDSMIANQPLLVSGGNVSFGDDGDPKKGSKGARSFVANKGNTVYIGVVHNATVAESARALKALGMENALNLDSGGSTALWSGGYKVGPGRNIPNAILFVRK